MPGPDPFALPDPLPVSDTAEAIVRDLAALPATAGEPVALDTLRGLWLRARAYQPAAIVRDVLAVELLRTCLVALQDRQDPATIQLRTEIRRHLMGEEGWQESDPRTCARCGWQHPSAGRCPEPGGGTRQVDPLTASHRREAAAVSAALRAEQQAQELRRQVRQALEILQYPGQEEGSRTADALRVLRGVRG